MNNNLQNNIYSSLIGIGLAELITLPICTIKTNFQNSDKNSIMVVTKNFYKNNGIKGFYNSSLPSTFGRLFSTSIRYSFYQSLTNNQNNPIKNKFLNGIIVGTTTSIITHPLDVIKIHLQMNSNFFTELKKEGLKIYYRGFTKTFTKIAISSSFFLPIYDMINTKTNNIILSSSISGIISTIIMQPVDYLKVRHIYGKPLYSGINPITYYKGLSLNLLRTVPNFVITMTTIEFLKKYYFNT